MSDLCDMKTGPRTEKRSALNMLIQRWFLKCGGAKIPTFFHQNFDLNWLPKPLCELLGETWAVLIRRQLMDVESQPAQVLETRLIVWNWCAECSKARRQDFDAVEIGTRFFERTTEFALHTINCCIRCHRNPALSLLG